MQVNFSRNLAQIIREIKYLDAMGFHLPEFALSVTLQEDKYDVDVESLENMLEVHV
jgi:dynein heavy chain